MRAALSPSMARCRDAASTGPAYPAAPDGRIPAEFQGDRVKFRARGPIDGTVFPTHQGSTDPVSVPGPAPRRPLLARLKRSLRAALPEGRMLPAHLLERRHRTIVAVLAAHVPALFLFGLSRGYPVGAHALRRRPGHRAHRPRGAARAIALRGRMVAACTGLVTCSALLVHLWDGTYRGALPLLRDDRAPDAVPGLGPVPPRDRLRRPAPRRHGRPRAALGLRQPAGAAHPWRWALSTAASCSPRASRTSPRGGTNEQQLLRDPLTGLPSRLLLMNRLQSALARIERSGRGVAVLFIDLDRFKVVNDSLGHDAGDRLLLAVAERLRTAVRRHETPARFGGDEFVVVCEDLAEPRGRRRRRPADPQGALASPSTFQRRLGLHRRQHRHRDRRPTTHAEAADLIRDADAAMYRAKQAGGGRWSMFDQIVRDRAVARQAIEADLAPGDRRTTSSSSTSSPSWPSRPARSSASRRSSAGTAPGVGMVSPADFIPIAEETGLIVPIGAWVMREACVQAVRQFDDGHMVVRVNVSARQLTEPGLIDTVADALERERARARAACASRSPRASCSRTATAASPRSRRCATSASSVSLDDFGTGYCSLSYLRRLPIDSLKIDRSFVRGLGSEADDDSIVTSVIDLARSLGVSVVAEGVETEEQLAGLRARGCDTMQGFLFAQPGPGGRRRRPRRRARRLGHRLAVAARERRRRPGGRLRETWMPRVPRRYVDAVAAGVGDGRRGRRGVVELLLLAEEQVEHLVADVLAQRRSRARRR